MSARGLAGLLAAGRATLGVAILAAPEKVTVHWLGHENARLPVVGDLARSLGARDLALGIAMLATLKDPAAGSRVQAACAAVDTVDAIATVAARAALPRKGVIATVAVAGGCAAAGAQLSRRLARV
ncbi:MAG TPA: hypothetical protein VID48_06225 [Solirubrobacteraceae bacterium]